MPRNYWICGCGWSLPWAHTRRNKGEKPDIDIGLVIAQHVEKEHPESIYGDVMPSSVYQKWKR